MKVEAKKKVEKEIEKAPKHVQIMVAEQIKKLKAADSPNELENVRQMKGTNEPYYRMKFNDYRLLLYHDIENDIVNIRALAHRKDAYKKQNLPWRK